MIVSPLFAFSILRLTPSEALWPLAFLPFILVIDYLWVVIVLAIALVVAGVAHTVGQRRLLRYALVITVVGGGIDLIHHGILALVSQRVDILLEPEPWRILLGTFLVPAALIFLVNTVMAHLWVGATATQASGIGYILAVLTTPWPTLPWLDWGQGGLGRESVVGLAITLVLLTLAPIVSHLARQAIVAPRGQRIFAGVLVATILALAAVTARHTWDSLTPTGGSSHDLPGTIVFSARHRLYLMQANDRRPRVLANKGLVPLLWSPDGAAILAQDEGEERQLWVVQARDGLLTLIGKGRVAPGAWSPDGSQILLTQMQDGGEVIWAVRRDGMGQWILGEGSSPSWSPDGRRIAFASRRSGRWQIWVMLPDGGDPIQVTPDGGESPLWSPDGTVIAYTQGNRVMIMNADGSHRRRLPVDEAVLDARPWMIWSPDGTALAYLYPYPPDTGRPSRLYIWRGQNSPTLAYTGRYGLPLAWSPDGSWLAFARDGALWILRLATGAEERITPAVAFAWGGQRPPLAVHSVPPYPPTPTPTPFPPFMLESPAALVIHPGKPSVIYAGTRTGVIRRQESGIWVLSSVGIDYPPRVRALAIDPTDPMVVYAGTDGERTVPGALYRSIDGGIRWAATGLKGLDVLTILVHPRGEAVYVGTSRGVQRSLDKGITWEPITVGMRIAAITALAIDPQPAQLPTATQPSTPTLQLSGPTLYAGSRQGELYRSLDGGMTWRFAESVNAAVTALLVAPGTRGKVFAATEEGLYTSEDYGETWTPVAGGIWRTRLDGLVVHPRAAQVIYAFGNGGVFVSHDGGSNWGPASSGLEGAHPTALAIDPWNPAILWVGTDKGIFRSENGGITWSR